MNRTVQYVSSVVFGVAVFLFRHSLYPHLMGFQEQNQLFLFTWDFFAERMSVSGGFADYIAEFLTQFGYIPVLGDVITALLFVAFQFSLAMAAGRKEWYSLSFVAPVLLLVHMCDIYVMMCFLVALTICALLCALYRKSPGFIWASFASFIGYWLIGPVIFVFALFVAIKEMNRKSLLVVSLAILAVFMSKFSYLQQYPWKAVSFGINYYRLPLTVPAMQVAVALAALIPAFTDRLPKPRPLADVVLGLLVAAGGVVGCCVNYEKDVAELIAYDQLVRHEDWNGILKRAEKYQPDSELGCVSVNLALFMSGRGAELPRFKQYGTKGLILPSIRDFISNSSSCEVFWRLGMINESLRYAFDTQESLINNRKSGRWMSRMAQCQILNGRYDVAEKYLDILSHSLFYRKWAEGQRRYLRNETAIASDPIYAYLQSVRYESDFFYFYPEMDKMLAILYHQNKNNMMAAWYYQAWTAMKKYDVNDAETYTGNAHGN